MIIFAHRHAAAVARRSAGPAGGRSDELDRTGRTYQVASAHCRFSAVACEEVVTRSFDIGTGLVDIGEQLAVALLDLSCDEHGVNIGHVGAQHHCGDRVDHRGHVQRLGLDDHDVGLLARCQRAGAILDPGDVRAVDGCRLEHLARGQHILGYLLVRLVLLGVHPGAIGSERGPHLGEHVARNRRHHVDRQAGPQPHSQRVQQRRPAVAHRISTCGATETLPPLSLTSCHSSSLKWQQWM